MASQLATWKNRKVLFSIILAAPLVVAGFAVASAVRQNDHGGLGTNGSARAATFLRQGTDKFVHRDFAGAAKSFSLAIAALPTDADAYTSRAVAYNALGRRDLAIADDGRAIAFSRNPIQKFIAYFHRSLEYAASGNAALAAADCTRAIETAPTMPPPYLTCGVLHERLGRNNLAIQELSTFISFLPKGAAGLGGRQKTAASGSNAFAVALYVRGMAKVNEGKAAGGNADIAEAKRVDANIAGEVKRSGVPYGFK